MTSAQNVLWPTRSVKSSQNLCDTSFDDLTIATFSPSRSLASFPVPRPPGRFTSLGLPGSRNDDSHLDRNRPRQFDMLRLPGPNIESLSSGFGIQEVAKAANALQFLRIATLIPLSRG